MTTKPRIMHLITGLDRGGAEVLLTHFFTRSSQDYEYLFGYLRRSRFALVGELTRNEPPVCFNCEPLWRLPAAVLHLARYLRQQKIDLLHCHLPFAGVIGRVAARIAKVPVVYTEHNVMEAYHPITRLLNRLTWSWQDYGISVSSAVQSSIYQNLSPGCPVVVVPNGIVVHEARCARDRELLLESLSLRSENLIVGTVAKFRAEKALDDWIRVASRVHHFLPQTRFILVGDGSLRPGLEELTARLNLREVVFFLGERTDVKSFLRGMDAYLLSSKFEGLPLALLEAMSMGLPCVATSVGGVPQAITDGKTGFLVPYGRIDELADRVVDLLKDPSLREKLGQAARVRVLEQFDAGEMIRVTESIYSGVLARRLLGA